MPFSCVIGLARIFTNNKVDRVNKIKVEKIEYYRVKMERVNILVLFLILKEKLLAFSTEYDVSCGLVIRPLLC